MAIQDGEDIMRMDHSAEEIDAAIESINEIRTHLELHDEELDNKLGRTETAAAAVCDGAGGNIAEQFAEDANALGIVKTTLGTECKNLLPVNCSEVAKYGVTLTPTEDGGININGVATVTTSVVAYGNLRTGATELNAQYDRVQLFPPGNYIISGSGYSNVKIQICGMTTEETSSIKVVGYATTNDKEVTVSHEYLYTWVRLLLDNSVSQTYDNITVYPMIRRADVTDGTYAPYKPSLQTQIDELKAQNTALEARIAALETTQ